MEGVRLVNVYKRFGATEVLKGISLDIEPGEFVVLVGPSGCGKSTLLNLVAGLETLSDGEVYIGDHLVNNVPPKDRDIAMVFQSYSLYPTKTVRDNIVFGMQTRRIPRDEQKRAVEAMSELLHIDVLLDRKPAQLSGGQRQRVAMARALVRDPHVFLFDEPLSNLDAKLRIEMRTEIKKLHQRLGKTMIYVTHDQIEAMTLASRIAVMDNGHVRQFASPEEIYEHPADLFVAGFMGSPPMNIVRGRVVDDNGPHIAVVDKNDEVRFPVPSHLRSAASSYVGKDLQLGIRPETMGKEGSDMRGTELFSFERRVEVVEPTGPDTMIVFNLGGEEAIARVHPEDAVPAGSTIRLTANMAKAKLFEVETGKSL